MEALKDLIRIVCWDVVYFMLGFVCISVFLLPSIIIIRYDGLHGTDAIIAFLAYIAVLVSYFIGRYYIMPKITEYVRNTL